MAVNQKQIAEKLGVSITLVSRVLSGKAAEIGIASATIERVMQVAKELGYVPSAAALSLKGKATRTIGVAVYDFNDPFFGALIEQLQAEAHANDYSLVLAGFLQRVPDERDVQSLHKHAIDGLVILGSDPVADWVKAFDHLPVARIGHGPENEKSVRISVDEQAAARQLLDYLAAAGRKRLVCLSANSPAHVWRQDTLAKEAAAAGVRLKLIQSRCKDPFKAGMELINLLPGVDNENDALLCTSDQVAMGALHALYDAGIRIPEGMAVTGFDGIVAGEQFLPPITTIRQPVGEMAKEAFESVTAAREPGCMNLAGKLVVRASA